MTAIAPLREITLRFPVYLTELRFQLYHACRAEAVVKLLAQIIPLIITHVHSRALAKQDGSYLTFKLTITAWTIFRFMRTHKQIMFERSKKPVLQQSNEVLLRH